MVRMALWDSFAGPTVTADAQDAQPWARMRIASTVASLNFPTGQQDGETRLVTTYGAAGGAVLSLTSPDGFTDQRTNTDVASTTQKRGSTFRYEWDLATSRWLFTSETVTTVADFRGGQDLLAGDYPAGAVSAGDWWVATGVANTVGTVAVDPGDVFFARVPAATNTDADWVVVKGSNNPQLATAAELLLPGEAAARGYSPELLRVFAQGSLGLANFDFDSQGVSGVHPIIALNGSNYLNTPAGAAGVSGIVGTLHWEGFDSTNGLGGTQTLRVFTGGASGILPGLWFRQGLGGAFSAWNYAGTNVDDYKGIGSTTAAAYTVLGGAQHGHFVDVNGDAVFAVTAADIGVGGFFRVLVRQTSIANPTLDFPAGHTYTINGIAGATNVLELGPQFRGSELIVQKTGGLFWVVTISGGGRQPVIDTFANLPSPATVVPGTSLAVVDDATPANNKIWLAVGPTNAFATSWV